MSLWYRPKKPYQAWKVKKTDFPISDSIEIQLKFILKYAVLAPSTFNVQPWLFSIHKNKIIVSPDIRRKLKTSDKENRLLYISLGCAVTNLLVAGKYFGFNVKKSYRKEKGNVLIELNFNKVENKKNNTILLEAIKTRLTNRNPYVDKVLPEKYLQEIKKIGGKKNFVVTIIKDEEVKKMLTSIVEKGDLSIWNDPKFIDEHLKWVRNNITRKHDGMPAFSVGIPLIASFFADFAIRYLPYAKIQSKKNKYLLSTTPYFGLILSSKHDKETWIKVGEVLEEIWLYATSKNVSLAPLAQVHAIGELYKETQKVLKTSLRPQFFFRLGYASKPSYNSPRRSAEEVLV